MGAEPSRGPVACLVTTPPDQARVIAVAIVEARLAACVNIVGRVESIYRWQGNVEQDEESLLVIKTTRDAVVPLIEAIGAIHRYANFELVTIGLEGGSPRYLRWIEESVLDHPADHAEDQDQADAQDDQGGDVPGEREKEGGGC